MFEKIDVKEVVRRLSMPSEKKEIEAQESAEGVSTLAGKALHQAVMIANTLVDDCNYVIKNQSLHMQSVDRSHVGMLQISVGKDELFDLSHAPSANCLDLRKLKDITKFAKKSNTKHTDMITITEGEILTIATPGGVRQIRPLEGYPSPKLPELETAYEYDANMVELQTALKAMSQVGDLFSMNGEKGKDLLLSVKGSVDSCTARVGGNCLKSSNDIQVSHYSGNYLKLVQRIPKDFSVQVSFSDNYPLTLTFQGEIANTPVKGKLLLAPRVDNNADGKDSY